MRCCRSSCSASPSSAIVFTDRRGSSSCASASSRSHHLDPMEAEEVEPLPRAIACRWSAGRRSDRTSPTTPVGALYRRFGRRAAPAQRARRARAAARRDRGARRIDGAAVDLIAADMADERGQGREAIDETMLRRAADAAPPTEAAQVRIVRTEDPETAARIAELEERLDEQEAALRRVLTLLVDWVGARGTVSQRSRIARPEASARCATRSRSMSRTGSRSARSRRVIDKGDWDSPASRASSATPTRCSTCSRESGVKATFFTLGWVAERHPALIRRIVDAGARDRQPRLGPSTASSRWMPTRSAPICAARARRSRMRRRRSHRLSRAELLDRRAHALGASRAGGGGLCLFVERRAGASTIIMAGPTRRASRGGRWRTAR